MKKISYKVIHPKDTADKVRRDALNKMIDEKIQTTPELAARKDAVVSAVKEGVK